MFFLFWALAVASSPNYQECISPLSKTFPYCDITLSFEERVDFLVQNLTLQEKLGLIGPDPKCKSGTCLCTAITASVPRIGLGNYMWLVETNTGVASACLPSGCASTFSGPLGVAASFNRSLWFSKGDVISTEMRAFSNSRGTRFGADSGFGIGVTGFGPNINLAAHPLWGRNSETCGEDPYLSGQYATFYTRGMQQIDEKGYFKMRNYLKHFSTYEIEYNRLNADYIISNFDFFDTFLPAFRDGFVEGAASGAMCSYSSENGVPSCSNAFLLNDLVRNKWSREDAVITSDCGALSSQKGPPMNSSASREIAARSLNAGLDLEMGSLEFFAGTVEAIKYGMLSEQTVDNALRRMFMQLMTAGRFDTNVSWTGILESTINSTAHQRVVQEAAAQGLVLLKNSNHVIPLQSNKTIAVVGPQAVAQYGLLSDYFGDEVCFGGGYECIPTIGLEIAKLNGGKTLVEKGVDVNSTDTSGIQAALNAVTESDLTILVLGIDKNIERETVDRPNTLLPGLQEQFALEVLKTASNKPVILVLINGGILSIDNLVEPCDAIVEAFNLAFGAPALAKSLFGKTTNSWGKLPVTIYPSSYTTQINGRSMNMTESPGRTYRYYQEQPLFPFGFGLNPLTSFNHSCSYLDELQNFTISCIISNVGRSNKGDEVIMVYHSAGQEIRSRAIHPVPNKSLREFERFSIAPMSFIKHSWSFEKQLFFSLTNNQGEKVVYSGVHKIILSRGDITTDQTIEVTL